MREYDRKLYLAALAPLEVLQDEGEVSDPALFRKNVKNLAVRMSDQVPCHAKIQPDLQLYAEWETTSTKKDREANRKAFEEVHMRTSWRQTASEDKDKALDAPETQQAKGDASTMKRGEATECQDKFRLTVDMEQVFYNV